MHRRWAQIRPTLQALSDMVHAVVDVVSLSRVPCILMLLVLCMSFVTLFCLAADMAVFMCTVVVFVELFSHSVETVQIVEDIERKVVFVRHRMLILLQFVGQQGVHGHLLWCNGRVLVLEQLSPRSIYGGTWPAEIERNTGVHLSVDTTACPVE